MRILVVEDDINLCGIVCEKLKAAGYDTEESHDGTEAYEMLMMYDYDAVILDRMLPSMSGTEIVSEMRKRGIVTPTLMVTALDGISDRVDGLEAGADDYLPKPFAMSELIARVRALLRRPAAYSEKSTVKCGGVDFSQEELLLKSEKCKVKLSQKESALLDYFIRHDGQTLKREQIICSVWGSDTEIEEGNLDNYVYLLRRRLKSAGSTSAIKTVYGIGYRPEMKNEK